jgi:hypothetical protein
MATSEELVYAANPDFNGPASVTVSSDAGIPGERGTFFFLSIGDPNTYGNLNYTTPESLNENIQRFNFSETTTNLNINPGQLRLDSFSNPTKIYISNKNNSGVDVSSVIKKMFLSIESVKGTIKINKNIPLQTNVNITEFLILKVASVPKAYDDYVEIGIQKFAASTGFSLTNGEESIVTLMDNPKRYDTCININPLDEGYLDFYTFRDARQESETGTRWYNELALTPGSFPINTALTFTSGSAQLILENYPLPESVLPYIDQLTAENVSIQYSFVSTTPISASANVDSVTGLVLDLDNNLFTLTVDLKARKYSGSSWSNLTGSNMVHFVIAIDIDQTVI